MEDHGIPRYVVNLDLPPEERWREVISDYKTELQETLEVVHKDLRLMLGKIGAAAAEALVGGFLGVLARVGGVYASQELKAIAKQAELPLGQLVLQQLMYEACSACTSVVAQNEGETPWLARTMDWELPILERLTIEVEFQRSGEMVYLATTWAGYVGILTAVKPGAFAASVNFRRTEEGTLWQNLKKGVSGAWPVGFLLRQIFEDEEEYSSALSYLCNSELMSPCYYTICGNEFNEGSIITRDRSEAVRLALLKDEEKGLVQTNIDGWSDDEDMNILWSIERRATAHRWLKRDIKIEEDALWDLLQTGLIKNEETVYSAVMHPNSGLLRTRLP